MKLKHDQEEIASGHNFTNTSANVSMNMDQYQV